MDLTKQRVLLTGASGGIGSALAKALSSQGARLALVGRSLDSLEAVAASLAPSIAMPIVADLATAEGCRAAIMDASEALGGVDVLINNAGLQSVGPLVQEDPIALERTLFVNSVAPMLLARQVLPEMQARGSGCICNIGSAFGSIGFACHASYSASKFAVRGFSEALRRELAGSGVSVCYVAPRATATDLLDRDLAAACQMKVDAPELVAAVIVDALRRRRAEVFIGWPEKLAVRLNALLPGLFDRALAKQTRTLIQHTTPQEAYSHG